MVTRLVTCLLIILTVGAPVFADSISKWAIDAQDSSLSFEAVQNGAPVTGQFKQLSGNISFDPKKLEQSSADVTVDMSSVNASYADVAKTLVLPDWFNVAAYPSSRFVSNSFHQTVDGRYVADGTLTLRDKAQPVSIVFTLDEYTPEKAVISGSATLKRTAFGVGQGEWAGTSQVADDVKVTMKITAKPGGGN